MDKNSIKSINIKSDRKSRVNNDFFNVDSLYFPKNM